MSCNCGCGGCETKTQGPLLTEGKVKSLLSEGLQYHIDKKIPLFETVYRIGSDKHLALIKEARKMYSRNIIDLCEDDEALIKTHLGEFGLYEGESVPLDLPMLNESDSNYPDFDLNKNIRYQDTSISSGMWRYTGQEQGGKGVYRNLNNGQILAFDRSDFDIFRNNLSSHFDISEGQLDESKYDTEETIQQTIDRLKARIEDPNDGVNVPFLVQKIKDLEKSLSEAELQLTSQEKKIADDILLGLNEGALSGVLDKMKKYASKGLLTLAILSSVTQGLQAQGTPQNDINTINQQGIELIQQTNTSDQRSEKLVKDQLGKNGLKQVQRNAEELGSYFTATKGNNRNVIKAMATQQAKSHSNNQGSIQIKDSSTYRTSDGQMLYIMFYQVSGAINEAKKKKEKKDPPLNKPKRGGSKAYYVYVRDPKTKKIKKVSFGSGGLRAKIKNKQARNAFAKRHNCKNKKDRTKAGYWSCNLPRYAPALGLGAKMNTFW